MQLQSMLLQSLFQAFNTHWGLLLMLTDLFLHLCYLKTSSGHAKQHPSPFTGQYHANNTVSVRYTEKTSNLIPFIFHFQKSHQRSIFKDEDLTHFLRRMRTALLYCTGKTTSRCKAPSFYCVVNSACTLEAHINSHNNTFYLLLF